MERQRHYAYALRGLWPCFPVSPASYAERLAAQFHTRRWFSENQSFGLARKLDAFVDDVASVIQHAQYAQAHAMWQTIRLGVSATAFETA